MFLFPSVAFSFQTTFSCISVSQQMNICPQLICTVDSYSRITDIPKKSKSTCNIPRRQRRQQWWRLIYFNSIFIFAWLLVNQAVGTKCQNSRRESATGWFMKRLNAAIWSCFFSRCVLPRDAQQCGKAGVQLLSSQGRIQITERKGVEKGEIKIKI